MIAARRPLNPAQVASCAGDNRNRRDLGVRPFVPLDEVLLQLGVAILGRFKYDLPLLPRTKLVEVPKHASDRADHLATGRQSSLNRASRQLSRYLSRRRRHLYLQYLSHRSTLRLSSPDRGRHFAELIQRRRSESGSKRSADLA
jgi:hypothetical protein